MEKMDSKMSEKDAQELAQFQHQCDQMLFWINYKEVIVWPEDVKSASDSEALLKEKYAKFHEEVAIQEVRVNEVLQIANLMIQNGHPEELTIIRRREELKQSWQRMKKLALKRQMFGQELAAVQPADVPEGAKATSAKINDVAIEAHVVRGLLENFLRLQQLEEDCDEAKVYINNNTTIMTDDSHLNPANLNMKMQNHKALEQELFSKNKSMEVIIKISKHLQDIIKMWETLLAATQVKSVQLSQAWQQEKFNMGVDNMNVWLDEVEAILASSEFGSDLAAVEQLIKDHTVLEADVLTHRDIVEIITTAAQQFAECRHFDIKNIVARKNGVVERFDALNHSMGKRRGKLSESLRAQQLYRDIRTEEEWINSRLERIAGRGQDIETVRQMIRETQSILKEIQTHDPDVQRVLQAGYKLAEGHFLSADIAKRTKELEESWANMKEKAFQRKQSNQLVLLFLFNIKD